MKVTEITYSDGSTALVTDGITLVVSGVTPVSHTEQHINERDLDHHMAMHTKKPRKPVLQ